MIMTCEHKNKIIWAPHLAGAKKCIDCNMVYNPNMNPRWHHESNPVVKNFFKATAYHSTAFWYGIFIGVNVGFIIAIMYDFLGKLGVP